MNFLHNLSCQMFYSVIRPSRHVRSVGAASSRLTMAMGPELPEIMRFPPGLGLALCQRLSELSLCAIAFHTGCTRVTSGRNLCELGHHSRHLGPGSHVGCHWSLSRLYRPKLSCQCKTSSETLKILDASGPGLPCRPKLMGPCELEVEGVRAEASRSARLRDFLLSHL